MSLFKGECVKRHWDLMSSSIKYENRILKLREDTYHFLPNDIVQDFTVLEFADWVNIIPVTREGMVVIIRQYRHGIGRDTYEIPGGLMSAHDKNPSMAASREMTEETGYVSNDVIHLGTVEPNPAIQNNRCHTYLAKDVELRSGQMLDPTEAIAVELVEKAEIYRMIRDGRITHGLVVAAFAYLLLHEGMEGK